MRENIHKEAERLKKENERLSHEISTLKEKLQRGGISASDLGECMSKIVVNTENLNQKLYEVKDEIINTVVNLHAGVGADGSEGEQSGATAENKLKKNILVDMKNDIINTMVNLQASAGNQGSESNSMSYAAVTKKKNLLVLKSTDKERNVASRKDEVARALKDIPVVNTKFTSGGNAVLNFDSEAEREKAANVISSGLRNVEMNFTKKLHPKIMICNVSKEENKGDIVEYLVAKNGYLQTVEDVHDKMKLVFSKPAFGNTVHYILRGSPDIRELIHKHGDVVCLKWARYTVRDRYHVFNCFHCQRYGHTESNCKFKQNGDPFSCAKCAENHPTKDCTNDSVKCINCVRHLRPDIIHPVNSRQCKSLEMELSRLRDMTDHGY